MAERTVARTMNTVLRAKIDENCKKNIRKTVDPDSIYRNGETPKVQSHQKCHPSFPLKQSNQTTGHGNLPHQEDKHLATAQPKPCEDRDQRRRSHSQEHDTRGTYPHHHQHREVLGTQKTAVPLTRSSKG